MPQKLELTWIGKNDPKNQISPEPRILIENEEYSYGDPNTENMLIQGDNLLALKSLEQKYAGRIKCIYIDPPYNTGSAFEHYEDNLEHSTWLNLMKPRLELLNLLLSSDGYIFIQIDDNELSYLQVLCDEIFGRRNRVNIITVKMSETSGVKMSHVSKKLPKLKEYILVYKKTDKAVLNPIRIKKTDENGYLEKYLNYYSKIIVNPEEDVKNWIINPLKDYLEKKGLPVDAEFQKNFKLNNSNRIVYRTNNKSLEKLSFETKTEKVISPTGIEYIWWEGKQMLFLSDYIEEYLGDLWTDISTINLNKEGTVDFPKGKKPEKLIERIIDLATNPEDYVLDSFLGSGTTVAVAHKMGRKWIGIELGEHAKTHCYPRLKAVVDGEQGGISKSIEWTGGGGFKFYELAPSLLNEDKYGNLVTNRSYDSEMLAEAMTKHQNFTYAPDLDVFWKQGFSYEKDYIFTTTEFVNYEFLDLIHQEMMDDESLLICCKAFVEGADDRYENINIKKIPQAIIDKCDFGKDDYSLNVVESTENVEETDDTEENFE